jgi:hypothetical protein
MPALMILVLVAVDLAALGPVILTNQPSALTPQGWWCAI